jgi:S1-C subfamily serine protease
VRSELSRAAAFGDALAPFGGHIEPVARDGGVVGVALRGFPRDATPIAAGLANGDVVTSVNGVPIGTPGLAADALAAVRRSGRAVVEVLRGSRRVVLVVDWPTV